jgi:release factor glutamine methyltransferase
MILYWRLEPEPEPLLCMPPQLTDNQITVTDINLDALSLAEENFKINNIDNIETVFGNLFEPLENRKFDVIFI